MIKTSQSKFLQEARTLVENAAGLPELASVLSGYGYTDARFKEGLHLLDAADGLARKKTEDHGESIEATAGFAKAWAAANVSYCKTLKLARIALGDDAKAITALKMMGPRKQSFSGWFDQAGTFYDNLMREPRFVTMMAGFGYSKDRLAAERAAVHDVGAKYNVHAQESGSDQASTVDRDRKLKELDCWVSDLRGVCEVAFYEDREELEKLGPLAPTRRRRSSAKKKTVAAV